MSMNVVTKGLGTYSIVLDKFKKLGSRRLFHATLTVRVTCVVETLLTDIPCLIYRIHSIFLHCRLQMAVLTTNQKTA